jgi:hypothetical protein
MSLYEQIYNEKPLLDFCNEYPPLGKALIEQLKKTEYITRLELGVVWELQSIYKLDCRKSFASTYSEIFKLQF